jgi:hypothetical protein
VDRYHELQNVQFKAVQTAKKYSRDVEGTVKIEKLAAFGLFGQKYLYNIQVVIGIASIFLK